MLLISSTWLTCSFLFLSKRYILWETLVYCVTMPERICFRWQTTCFCPYLKGNTSFWKPFYSLGWGCPETKKYSWECSWESWGLLPALVLGDFGKAILDKMYFNLSTACTVSCSSLFITTPFFFCFFCKLLGKKKTKLFPLSMYWYHCCIFLVYMGLTNTSIFIVILFKHSWILWILLRLICIQINVAALAASATLQPCSRTEC